MQISVLLAEQIAELFLMILMGYVIVKLGLVTDDDSKILSKIVLYIVIPCVMINAFQIFDQIAAISKQSPLGSPAGSTSTVVTFLYQQSFSYMDMGYGSAAAMVLLSIIFLLSLIRMFISKEGE